MVYGAVASWCHQYGFDRGRKGTSQFLCGRQDIDKLRTGRSTTLGISSDNSTWKQDARNVLSFAAVASKIQLTQLCEKADFQYRVTAGKQYKIRLDGSTDGEQSLLCAENTHFSRSFHKSQVVAAIPEGTIIGPVLEGQTLKKLDGYGIEVAIPSIAHLANTSYALVSRENRAFCE